MISSSFDLFRVSLKFFDEAPIKNGKSRKRKTRGYFSDNVYWTNALIKNKKRLRQRSEALGNVFFSLAAAVCDANLGRKQEGMGTMHSFNYGSIPIRRVETHLGFARLAAAYVKL